MGKSRLDRPQARPAPIRPVISADLGEDVGLAQDHDLGAVDGDLGAAVLAEQDGVALGDVGLGTAAVIEQLAGADRQDLALGGLFLGVLGQQDAAGGLLFRVES